MKELIKLDAQNFGDIVYSMKTLKEIGIHGYDYTELIGRDLTEREKDRYFWENEKIGTLEIFLLIYNDYINGKL
jgi:hypothetical protein